MNSMFKKGPIAQKIPGWLSLYPIKAETHTRSQTATVIPKLFFEIKLLPRLL